MYLNWSIGTIIRWEQTEKDQNITHIHGTSDHVFPIKNINNCIQIEGGSHIMIITKAKKLTKIINDTLTS